MLLFGPVSFRRKRTARVSTLRDDSILRRIGDALANRNVLMRLFLCLFAMAVLLFAVEAWRTPFTYRLGDYQPHGILAQAPFKRINRFETDRARALADEQVPFVLRLEPTTQRGLLVALKAETGAVVWSTKNGDPSKGETGTSAPQVVKDKVLVGNSGGEFGVRGTLTAYELKTGKRVWRGYSVGPDSDTLIDPVKTTSESFWLDMRKGFHILDRSRPGCSLG